jgi:hypothetical protein
MSLAVTRKGLSAFASIQAVHMCIFIFNALFFKINN